MYRKLSSFRHESLFSTWLYRIATNAALMRRRAHSRRKNKRSLSIRSSLALMTPAHTPQPQPNSASRVSWRKRSTPGSWRKGCQAAVDRLPDLTEGPSFCAISKNLTPPRWRSCSALESRRYASAFTEQDSVARLSVISQGGEAMTRDLTCASGVDLLMDYLEDALPKDLRDRIESHVAAWKRSPPSWRVLPRDPSDRPRS